MLDCAFGVSPLHFPSRLGILGTELFVKVSCFCLGEALTTSILCRGADRFATNADQKTPWGLAFNSGSLEVHCALADAARDADIHA